MNGMTTKECDREERLLEGGNALALSLVHVVSGAALIAGVVVLAGSLMNDIEVDLGLHHYSESLSPLSTAWLPMPFNTVVNTGYVAVGIFWILRVRRLFSKGGMSADEAYLMYVFAWMVVVYGPVQFVRIVTNWHVAGILDQWYTLPIFAWVGVSCREIGSSSGRLNGWSVGLVMTISVASYGLAAVHSYGFEVALAAHIGGVVAQALWVHGQSSVNQQRRWAAFIRAVLCCVGFVSLKLADSRLVRLSPMPFAIVSGHFWSKVADFMQVHYACEFLAAALSTRFHSEAETVCDHKHAR